MIYYYTTGALGGWTENKQDRPAWVLQQFMWNIPLSAADPRDGDVDKAYTDSHSTGQVTDNT